jgi:drug/metabolite transporter (DMT)-like permease
MTSESSNPQRPARSLVVGAFLIVYVVWGSTYLGIKVAIETIPPLLMAGMRFLIAGAILYAVLWLRGHRLRGFVPWRDAALVGTALLAGGNGGVTWAERTVPSGIAALVIGSAPLWFALVDWLRPGGTRPKLQTWLGIVIGFSGVTLLAAPAEGSHRLDPQGFIVLLLACLTWATGSIYARHTAKPTSPWLAVAAQMLCGGVVLLVAACIAGEFSRFDPAAISARSAGAVIYLIVVGSWIGFSAYIWLLKASTPTKVSSYAYVNPLVAVFLGWAILDEAVTGRTLCAAAIIVIGVLVLTVPLRLRHLLFAGSGSARRSSPCAQ